MTFRLIQSQEFAEPCETHFETCSIETPRFLAWVPNGRKNELQSGYSTPCFLQVGLHLET